MGYLTDKISDLAIKKLENFIKDFREKEIKFIGSEETKKNVLEQANS